jgi:DNA-binding SARP family transcriptional activator
MLSRLVLLGPVSLTDPAGSSHRRASQQRRIAMLASIAASPGGAVSRDRLLGLLWPDRDERTARHLLADSLYVLRGTLGDDAIVTSGDVVRLSPDRVWTDVAEFRRAVSEGRWSDAMSLYRGDFLDAFHVRKAADFERWAHAERARLRALARRAASARASELERTGHLGDALAAVERTLEIAPLDEGVFRELMRLLVATDNRARAEVVASGFIERLALEVGVAPSAETMRFVRDARGTASGAPIVVVPPAKPSSRRKRTIDSSTAALIAQGRYHWHHRTRVDLERAIRYFTRAAERDARAAEAWCGLADSWVGMGGRGYAPVACAIEFAAHCSERALTLDDTLSATHRSLGGVNLLRRRWRDAESSLRSAIRLDPHNAEAHHWLSLALLTGFGARAEALREQAIGARLNPVSPMHLGALGWQRYLLGEYDLSRSSIEPVVDLNADLEEGHTGLARAAARLGDQAAVSATIKAGLMRRGLPRGDLLAEQASALAVLGDARRARPLVRAAAAHGATPLTLALAWASLGDATRAFQCTERESFAVYWAPQAVWWDPRFDAIRDDARFSRVRERAERVWAPEWV